MKPPKRNAKLNAVIDFYLDSPAFRKLKGTTQKQYQNCLKAVSDTRVGHRKLGNMNVDDITSRMLNMCYEEWVKQSGERKATYNKQCLSVVWRYGMSYDIMSYANPVSYIKTRSAKSRRVFWTRDQVKTFLDVAYSDFKYRNIGLILHMAYEWGQRIGDMRTLTWDCIDLEEKRISLTQNKRNASVYLPISDGLCDVLKQQKDDFGYQEYVAPKVLLQKGTVHPYFIEEVNKYVNEVKKIAGLPKELTAMDLRRTAVAEMMEGGVDLVGIMQVTGHQNIQSVKPYMVNTFSGASKALAARGNDDD
jgi:integrase